MAIMAGRQLGLAGCCPAEPELGRRTVCLWLGVQQRQAGQLGYVNCSTVNVRRHCPLFGLGTRYIVRPFRRHATGMPARFAGSGYTWPFMANLPRLTGFNNHGPGSLQLGSRRVRGEPMAGHRSGMGCGGWSWLARIPAMLLLL